ncbi:hypothetical protein ACFE04_017027 [Oxalis oulophora]
MENWRQQLAAMRTSLFNEGLLNDQFEDRWVEDPEDVEEQFAEFFDEASTRISNIENLIVDTSENFTALLGELSELRGSCNFVGAISVNSAANHAMSFFGEENIEDVEGFKEAFQKIKSELDTLKARMNSYFEETNQENGDITD